MEKVISLQDSIMANRCFSYGDIYLKINILNNFTKNKFGIALGNIKTEKFGSITVWETTENLYLVLYLFNKNQYYFTVTTDTKEKLDEIIKKLKTFYKKDRTPSNSDFSQLELKVVSTIKI